MYNSSSTLLLIQNHILNHWQSIKFRCASSQSSLPDASVLMYLQYTIRIFLMNLNYERICSRERQRREGLSVHTSPFTFSRLTINMATLKNLNIFYQGPFTSSQQSPFTFSCQFHIGKDQSKCKYSIFFIRTEL